MAETRGDLLIWIDMEMSGLDPDRERILEVAALITDGDLFVIAEGPEIVVHQPDSILDAMDDWNREHHGASGLVERVRASTVTEAEAEARLLELFSAHCEPGTTPLCGSSVHQDRRFLRRYMPKVDDFMHYRIVDVSTVKELCRRWYPKLFDTRPTKEGKHRALEDIRESVEELRWYRENAFK